jgi:hypothetical protein
MCIFELKSNEGQRSMTKNGFLYKKLKEIDEPCEFEKVLNQAKQEYEALLSKWQKEYPGDGGDIVAIWRKEWFLKWFGK